MEQSAKSSNDTCNVELDDGNLEEEVLIGEERPVTTSPAIPEPISKQSITDKELEQDLFQVGVRVEARYRGRAKRYYKGAIKAVYSDGTYDIDYDDGDRDRRLSSDFIRLLPMNSTEKIKLEPPEEILGDAIESKDKPGRVNDNINKENTVPSITKFEVGDRVEARYKGKGRRWYKGTIKVARSNRTYDIDYDDGNTDRRLSSEMIRPIEKITQSLSDAKSSIALLSPTRNQPRLKHQAGEISTSTSCIKTGGGRALKETGNIQPSNNDNPLKPEEKKVKLAATNISSLSVPSSIISMRSNGSHSSDNDTVGSVGEGFTPGDKVEALFRGRGKRWYKGHIISRLPNGFYNVRYDAGDTDLRLSPKAVRAIGVISSKGPETKCSKVASTYDDECYEVPKAKETTTWQMKPGTKESNEPVPENCSESDKPSSMVEHSFLNNNDNDASSVLADEQLHVSEESDINETRIKETLQVPTASAVEISMEDISNESEAATTMMCHGKGNKLFRGVISKVRAIHLYEVSYPDGSKDFNLPFEALQLDEGVNLDVGKCVDVISWQDRRHF